ncbi:DNA topoisomerase III [Myxozyma melibiosi]|uniref:DNA topoisomerase n=1 Tax=Myxozyma melibiosi TaxID=54550 RepID=A0ABR1FD08_9ASCO
MKILCVAEKPSIAKSVAHTLGGGRVSLRETRNKYIKNYDFTYNFPPPYGSAEVTMTSVMGHIFHNDFTKEFSSWDAVSPIDLFRARILKSVPADQENIARNIRDEAGRSQLLIIWTDCDREGEHIGVEVLNIARERNRNIGVKRAMFNNLEAAHIHQAARSLRDIDHRLAQAVDARMEIDLRLGAAFTRFQSKLLRPACTPLKNSLISYGSCQFPTLGFVVDRFKRVRNFRPETFWYIKVVVEKDGITVNFNWKRVHLFDRMATTLLFERCMESSNGEARIVSMVKKPTSKWRPLPLTTVELQRRGALFLGFSSKKVMDIAEKLYTKGFLSYPRTETDQFDDGMDLQALIEKQVGDASWGGYAQGLLNGGFCKPKKGKHNDHAHPPIHPVAHCSQGGNIAYDEIRVYELVARHFLACCSEDAKGASTEVVLDWAGERFGTTGLRVVQRNYLDVYKYDRWTSSQELPEFSQGELVTLKRATMEEGTTTAPGYLTEPELIQQMDANGIGTDATMADHIDRILDRGYVVKVPKGAGGRFREPLPVTAPAATQPRGAAARGGGRGGRGARGGGRGGRGGGGAAGRKTNGANGGSGDGQFEFIPSTLGFALAEGYDAIGFDKSLMKPFLRRDLELSMTDICEGRKTKEEVIQQSLSLYREVFQRSNEQKGILVQACRRYVV